MKRIGSSNPALKIAKVGRDSYLDVTLFIIVKIFEFYFVTSPIYVHSILFLSLYEIRMHCEFFVQSTYERPIGGFLYLKCGFTRVQSLQYIVRGVVSQGEGY
jgi:hypothetical protein